ncbi:MAG: DUF6531 domain-containing protein [Kiritimatiellae bacterium]|nr:DUF6531 domain-containing protein [Kiritimatiellia bacterium]
MKTMTHSVLFGAMLLAAVFASGAVVTNATVRGTLATSWGASIRDDALASWIYTFIPTNTPKLLVLTQCFGGDMANEFADKPNTVVLSATSTGEEAMYGGYDAGAAGAMQPGAGRTAQDIHNAGVANRDTVETPRVAGGLNPTNFPMTSVSTSGVVRSRHVVWYAGQPDGLPGRDFDQDARLHGVFAGEGNTTYRAVAASTTGGWDYDGTARGLREAILEAAVLIAISPNPAAEQFILYASDHGDRHVTAAVATALPTDLPIEFSEFPTFSRDEMEPKILLNNTNTIPGFSIFVPFEPGGPVFTPGPNPFFPPLDWQLTITIPDQPSFPPLFLTAPVELPLELDNGIVGDLSGEGIQLFFPVDKQFFVDSFFDVFVTLEVTQTTGQTWPIASISQDSGEVPKGIAPSDGRALRLDRSRSEDIIPTEMVALSLHGIDGGLYPIQARTSLLTGEWETLDTLLGKDTIPGAGGRLTYPILPSTEPTRFFRALFPQPTIAQVEPAMVATDGDDAFFYIVGSGFYPRDTVLIGGLPALHVEFDAHNLLHVFLPASFPPGLHDVTVVSGHNGAILATLPDALEVAPSLARTLQGPPAWPPAGPASALPSHYGHVTVLKQQADGHVTVLKSQDEGQATVFHAPFHNYDVSRRYIGTEECDDGNALDIGRSAAYSRRTDSDLDRSGGHRLDEDSDGDGILDLSLHAGEVEQQVVDLAVPGRGLDFLWVRTYRSRTGVATTQGNRWSHSYDVRCVRDGGAVDLYDGTGRKDTFRLQANGTYTCPEFFREGTLLAGVFRLFFADTGYWEFNPFGTSPSSGKLAQIVDRHGNTMTLSYDGSGRLTTIIDDLGRTYTVAYNPTGQIASVSDFSGRTVTYAYYSAGDSNGRSGDLKSVTSPAVIGTSTGNDFPYGKTTTYVYSTDPAPGASGLLTSIIDAHGQNIAQCTYEITPSSFSAWRAISLQRGTDQPARITYLPQSPAPDNRFAALRCIVNDPEGNVSEHDFDVRNRCVTLREFTGRAEPGQAVTATDNRPAGKLRAADPDFFESTWSWNNDSLCTLWQRPLTNRIEWSYQADLDPATPARQRGNLREERCVSNGDLDHDGMPDILVSSFEHDPRFGSDHAAHFTAEFSDGRYVLRSGHRRKPWLPSNFRLRSSEGVDLNCDGRDDDCDGLVDESFVTRVTNPRGFETRCEYDANGNLVTLTRHGTAVGGGTPPVLAREDYEYNVYGQPAAITNAADGNGYRRYDLYLYEEVPGTTGFGYLTGTIVDAGAAGRNLTTGFEYDARGNLTRCVDPRGTPTDIEVNALNQIVSRKTQGATLGERVRVEYHYNAADQIVLAERGNLDGSGSFDPNGGSIAYAYDPCRRPIRRVDASPDASLSVTNEFSYNGNDRLVRVRSPLAVQGGDPLHATHYAYDERGLLFRETRAPGSPLQATTQCDYDANGNLRIMRCGLEDATGGRITQYSYDGLDRCVRATDPMGNETHYAYDANGNLLSATQTDRSDLGGPDEVFVRRYAYDVLDRCVADWDNAGNTNRYLYDSRGNRVRHTDPLGFYQEGDFDGLSRPTSNRQGVGGSAQSSTHYAYDAASRLIAAIDSNTNTTQYAYDSLDRVIRITLADNTSVTNVYDVHGNLVWTRDANGTQIFLAYDALNRCIQKTVAPGTGIAPDTTFETYQYDGLSRLVSAANNHTEVVRDYDSLGRCVREGTASPALGFNYEEIKWTYDAHGLKLAQTNPSGRIVEYSYDALDRPVALEWRSSAAEPLEPLAAFAYSGPDRLARVTRANGVQSDYTYSGLDRVANLPGDFGWRQIQGVRHTLGGEAALDNRIFAYDRNQNKTLRALTAPFVAGGWTNQQEFAYDSLDRLVHSVATTNGVTVRDTAYALDAMGNRLSVIRDGTNQPYDAFGRRIARVVYDGLPPTPVFTNRYLYAGGQVVEEEDGGGAVQRTYAFPHVFDQKGRIASASSTLDGTRSFDDNVIRSFRAAVLFEGSVVFNLCDDQGSLLALTDEKGHVLERFDYDDYGVPIFLDADGAPRPGATASLSGVTRLFHDMEWDEETGLHFMDKAELVDLILKNRKASATGHLDPNTGGTLSRTYASTHLLEQSGRSYARNNPGSSGGTRAQDYNSSRSNNSSGHMGSGGGSGTRAQDYNSSRSNNSSGHMGSGGEFSYTECFPTRYVYPAFSAQGTGNIRVKLIVPVAINKGVYATKKVAKFKAGKALAETVK